MQNVTAIILAAGKGERLYPYTQNLPKSLLLIGDMPIIYYQLDSLSNIGIKNIIIVVGYRKGKIKNYIHKNFPNLNVFFIINPIYKKTNTLYSLTLASIYTPKKTEILLINGDVLFDSILIKKLLKSPFPSAVLTLKKECFEEEVKIYSNNGNISRITKKFVNKSKLLGESVGIYKFSPLFWDYLSKKLIIFKDQYKNEYFEFAIESILKKHPIFPLFPNHEYVTEIDYESDLLEARISFFSKRIINPPKKKV